ncbi:MAG: hypothetical protein E7Z63_01140 [Thermoplasmata archaeon]|nr:hypothetical protein [Thermoplasmata archaeon]
MEYHGFLQCIARDPKRRIGVDYIYLKDYRPGKGYWGNGYYDLSYPEALEMFSESVKYHFDPEDPKAIEFMRGAKFNWNHVGEGYLEKNDYRDPDFDIYAGNIDRYNDMGLRNREEFEQYREDYILKNPNSKPRDDDFWVYSDFYESGGPKKRSFTDKEYLWMGPFSGWNYVIEKRDVGFTLRIEYFDGSTTLEEGLGYLRAAVAVAERTETEWALKHVSPRARAEYMATAKKGEVASLAVKKRGRR